MMKRLLFVALAAALSSTALAQTAPPPARLETMGAKFGMREAVEDIALSPDGRRLAYVAPGRGRISDLMVVDLASGQQKRVFQSSGSPERLQWCNFVGNERLVCRITALLREPGGQIIPFGRLISMTADGTDVKQLGQRRSEYDRNIRQYDGNIIDWLPGDADAVLMSRSYVPEAGKIGTLIVRNADGLGVDRVNVRTLASKGIERPRAEATEYISDGRGNVRMMAIGSRRGATGQVGTKWNYLYRMAGSNEWLPFGDYDFASDQGLLPLAVDATTDSAYALRKLNGRFALFRVKLDGSMATELAYKNDKVDVSDVVRAGRGARVIGATFAEEEQDIVYFDDEYRKLAAALSQSIPNLPIINFRDWTADGDKILLYAGSDTNPGKYFLLDKSSRQMSQIIEAHPLLAGVPLAPVKPITYPASDGTLVPAYLTLPPGKADKGLPAIVLPHGGPESRDTWGFDWLAQFLANQGYAVLQPNFRGSAGYGDAWLAQNGFKSWNVSIGDVTAGARWLAAQGIANPEKLAILGWSYGGYAALQSGVADPGLFKAIVAIAPVTDLGLLKTQYDGYTNARNIANYVGSGPHVEQGSPLRNAAQISAPVLMFHGDMDLNVAIDHSRKMDSALRNAGKRSELVVYEGLEHSLVDSNARAQMLDRIAAFLKSAVGS